MAVLVLQDFSAAQLKPITNIYPANGSLAQRVVKAELY